MKRVAISGASGFVGTNLRKIFESKGYEVRPIHIKDFESVEKIKSIIDGCETIVNLAGANIINRWSDEYKKILYSSRIDTTNMIIDAISDLENKPKLLISTSAVGIYKNDKEYDENTQDYSNDFLSNLCQDWEKSALKAENYGVRVAIFRFGIVLGDGGALGKMMLPFKIGLGGVIGSGMQALSFIHIDDLKSAYMYAIENESIKGRYNLVSPNPTTNRGLTKALGRKLKRLTIMPIPSFVLDLIFGEGAKVLTDGQRVVPKKLIDSGFKFKFQTIEESIQDIVSKQK